MLGIAPNPTPNDPYNIPDSYKRNQDLVDDRMIDFKGPAKNVAVASDSE